MGLYACRPRAGVGGLRSADPSSRRPRIAAAWLFFSFLLGGCAVPNVKPFADATAAYREAITTAGATVADALRRGSAPETAPEAARLWSVRVRVADALVYYAGGLSNIVAASRGAAESAQRLGDTVGELAALVPTTGAMGKEAVAIGAVIGRTVVEVKAARDLAGAVEKAHPALAQIAEILKKDLWDLKALCANAYTDIDQGLVNAWRPNQGHYEKLVEAVVKARSEAAMAGFDAPSVGRLRELEGLLAAREVGFGRHRDARATVAVQRAAAEEMLDQAITGTDDWVRTHAEIGAALRANRLPNIALLMSRAQEIENAVRRIRTR